MGLPGHRRTSSHKRRRASHFALQPQVITTDTQGENAHLQHRAAPGSATYRGHVIHIKGKERKIEKLLKKSKKSKESATS